jgi:hypothetical protein
MSAPNQRPISEVGGKKECAIADDKELSAHAAALN